MRNVDGIVKIKSSLRRKCIEILVHEHRRWNRARGRASEREMTVYGVTARLCRYWHTHTHTLIYSDRLKMLRLFFFCVKIADSDSRSICNPHLSISLAWHGFPLALPHNVHTHTRIHHLLYGYFDALSLSWPRWYCDGWWCARREAAALAHHARVTSCQAILFFFFFVPSTMSSSSFMFVRWCHII